MVVLVVELLGIPVRQVRSRFKHRQCTEFFRTASSIGVPLPVDGAKASVALTRSTNMRLGTEQAGTAVLGAWSSVRTDGEQSQNALPLQGPKKADLPVLSEASLPTTSCLSQLEARKSCAASVNDSIRLTGETAPVNTDSRP
jgi:hypothetical protein